MTFTARVDWHGARARLGTHDGAVAGLRKATEHILGVSRERVPLEEGTLERSGVASVDEVELIGAVSYDTPYAVRQHEELGNRHAPGRTAKYLEEPMIAEHETALALIAAEMRRALR